jgi:predicted dehydrogenase
LLVGCGDRGHHWGVELEGHPGWELTGIVDPDETNRLRSMADRGLSADAAFTTLQEADKSGKRWDAVLIVTPPESHEQPARWAIERGYATFIEKPFTATYASARALVDVAESAGVPLMVGQNYRYLRWVKAVKRIVDQGELGDIGHIVANYHRVPNDLPPSLTDVRHSAAWGMAVHHLDALMYVLGKNVVNVSASSSTRAADPRPPGATFQLLAEMEDGVSVTYSASYESSGHEFFEAGQEFYERITGREATLHVFQRWLFLCPRGKLPRPVRRGPRPKTEETILLDELTAAITTGVEPRCSGRDNLKIMAVMEACIRSAEERRWVSPVEVTKDV